MSYISHSEFKHLMSKFQAETPKGMLKEAVDVKDRGYQDNITPESPLDEEDEMEEGNAFTGQLHKHKPGEKFKVGGKEFKDKTNYDAPIKEGSKNVDVVFSKYESPLLKALALRARNQEDVDAHDAVDRILRTIAKELGLKSDYPYMEDEMFSGTYSPKEALAYAKEMFASELEDGELDEYRFDQMYPEDPGPFEEGDLNEEGSYGKIIPALKAKGITHAMPENEIFKAIAEVMKELGYTPQQIRGNMYDHDFLPDLLDMLKKSESRMEEGEEDLVSKILKYVKDPDDAEHYASHPESMPSWLKHMIKGEKKQDMPGFGGTWDSLNKLKGEELNEYEQHYEIVNGQCRRYNDEGEYDVVSMHYCRYNESEEMEENIYEPLQKATGVNIGITKEETNDTNPPYGFSVLSPDERKQLKEYIESLKTIKKEISTLLEKAGKSTMMESDKAGYVKGGEIKNKKKETDTKHPATIKAKYHEPTHKQKTGGDRTNLVMKKSEMWEGHESDMDPKHEEMESKIDPKLHDVLHKVADKVISELEAAGFTRQEALMFLDHEIAEKGEEAKMDQYNPF